MKVLYSIIFCFLFFSILTSSAQNLRENEIVVIKGKKYVLHQVRTGETVYSITRDFKVERTQLTEDNPEISDGLNIGQILKIPYREGIDPSQRISVSKGDPTRFKYYVLTSRKETPYFLAKKFGITVEELFAYNPEIRKFRRKTKVRIPIWDPLPENIKEEETERAGTEPVKSKMKSHTVVSGETLYSLSRKYGVTEKEILSLNPEAENLKTGTILNIPIQSVEIVKDDLEMEGDNFFEHIIESGETMWGITRKYKVSEQELVSMNPVLKKSFPAGVVIKVPLHEKPVQTQAKPVNEEAFLKHRVNRGETLFGLSSKFNLKIHEIKKYNPVLEMRNLVAGEIILIPRQIKETGIQIESDSEKDSLRKMRDFYRVELPVEVPESCLPAYKKGATNEEYTVALFLPLFLQANDTLNRETPVPDSLVSDELVAETELLLDTVIEKEEPRELFKSFFGDTESYVQFYEGVLLGIDSMKKQGMNVILNVFDTQRSADSIRDEIYMDEFLETDLIIGPVFPDVQEEVAQIAAKNRIPMVSPLSSYSELTRVNPYIYQVIPSREYVAERTAEIVAEEYYESNFIVLKTADYSRTIEGEMVNLIQEKLFNSGHLSTLKGVSFTIYDFDTEGPFGLRRVMSDKKENVVFIPTMDEGELSIAISNVNNLSDEFSITLIGSNRYKRFASINIEQYHNLKMKYIAPYWMEYDKPGSLQFLNKFKENFHTEPNSFGVQGFDVSFYFLNALNIYGKDFASCLPYLHVDLIQGNYHFEKISRFGGYINQGVSLIYYSRDYEVARERILGQPKLIVKNQ